MLKVSVVTMIYRPGYIDSMADALRDQTLKDFEWIIIDDLYEQRKDMVREYVGSSLNLKHIPSREPAPYSATAMATNTGIINAEGHLVYFMADYMYPHPRTLERHWEIYSKYGPKVMISGPLLDGVVILGKSLLALAWTPLTRTRFKNEEGKIIEYPEFTPPIPWEVKDTFEECIPDNLISVFKEPFKPSWPKTLVPDWRLIKASKFSIDKYLCETYDSAWFWGRNDSAPLEALLEINGMNEAFDGRRAAADSDLGARLMKYGCRYLVDREAPSYMLPHPVRKRANMNISKEESERRIAESQSRSVPNDYSLRVEREKLLR